VQGGAETPLRVTTLTAAAHSRDGNVLVLCSGGQERQMMTGSPHFARTARQGGFTLIELLIVVAMIAVLAAPFRFCCAHLVERRWRCRCARFTRPRYASCGAGGYASSTISPRLRRPGRLHQDRM
jgi:prepilin-type N-terminal cleavage/methylation domain-containing protein